MALEDLQTLIDNLVRDDSDQITDEHRDQALLLAVVRYSTDRPRIIVEELTAAGGSTLDLPVDWDLQFSRLEKLEIPDGDSATPVSANTEQVLSGVRIRAAREFQAGTVLHIYFTAMHIVDADNDTVPIADREAVAAWASNILLEQLATMYSGASDPTFDADTVDHQAKGRDFARRAKDKRQMYLNHLGIDSKRVVAHGVVIDFDQEPSHGRGHLTHSNRRR